MVIIVLSDFMFSVNVPLWFWFQNVLKNARIMESVSSLHLINQLSENVFLAV